MADTFLVDPLGREITLHDHTWFGHIIKGHPGIKSSREQVEAAVEQPQEIRFSSSDADCRIYYGSGPRLADLIAVVADVVEGYVKTAYPAPKMKGALEWLPSTHSKGSSTGHSGTTTT